MIDLNTETVVSFTEALDHLPHRRGGRPVHVATLYRWAQRGLRGVQLETLQVGGTRCTSIEALQRFFDRLGGQASPAPNVRTPHQREVARSRADAELERSGW